MDKYEYTEAQLHEKCGVTLFSIREQDYKNSPTSWFKFRIVKYSTCKYKIQEVGILRGGSTSIRDFAAAFGLCEYHYVMGWKTDDYVIQSEEEALKVVNNWIASVVQSELPKTEPEIISIHP